MHRHGHRHRHRKTARLATREVVRERACVALGLIRLANGSLALFAPETMARRVDLAPASGRMPTYPLRMFGIRTVVLAADLLVPPPGRRATGPIDVLIHATDTWSAFEAGRRAALPRRVAALATAISATNTALALAGLRAA
jgi:hypothetical protein